MNEFKIIAKTMQGLEEVLAKELTELGADNIEIGRRMVSFTGDKCMLYKANFCLRTAIKILKPIKEFKADDADEVYEVVKKMDWSEYMDCSDTFIVDSVVFSDKFRHSQFVAYRVKDAIADYWREKTNGSRPNVAITNPDIRINVHVSDNDITISLDSSGESLHIRGYKTNTVKAPINEVLAAGLIMLTGWKGECDLIDPFCGSGTILIEAALIAKNIYPGVFRKEYAFEKWKDFDEDMFESIYNDDSQEREFDHKIYGYDINRQAVSIATENARNAGVNKCVEIEQRDFYDFDSPRESSIMITNPPYGERIVTDDMMGLYATIGQRLKKYFTGNDAWIITNRNEYFDQIGFKPSTRIALFNGSIECEFRKYSIFSGKIEDFRGEGFDLKTKEDRERNLKFKPHKRSEEDSEEDMSQRDSHYFKSKPYKDQRRKREDERDSNRKSKEDSRTAQLESRRQFFEATDDEEREILKKYNDKWGGRGHKRLDVDLDKNFHFSDRKKDEKEKRKSFNPNFNEKGDKRFDRKRNESKDWKRRSPRKDS